MNTDNPMEVLKHAYAEIVRRRPVIGKAVRYYDGDHDLAFASEKFLEAFGGLFHAFADNWCPLVIGATTERLQVNGFRVGTEVDADDEAKRIWETNELDLQSSIGHGEALTTGAMNVVVWNRDDDEKTPDITIEGATTSIVLTHPKRQRERVAGLRLWLDEDGYEHAELFLPKRVYVFRSKGKRTSGLVDPKRSQWVAEDHPEYEGKLDASSSMPNPLGVVPMVPFVNIPRLTVSRRVGWAAHSELCPIIPLQDATNKMLADLLIASEFAAYPQRWVLGWDPDTNEETDEVIPPKFRSGPGATWWTEQTKDEAAFGTFDVVQIDQYVKSIEMLVQHIASISRTPPHYLRASADRLSGESLKSAETGLVAKVYEKQRQFGASWEEVMRLAGRIADVKELAAAESMETIWKDPETRSESEHMDALQKKQAIGVPDQQLQEEAGYTPEQMARFPSMRARSDVETVAAGILDVQNRLGTSPTPAVPPAPIPNPDEA